MREQINNDGSKSHANSELIVKPESVIKALFSQFSWNIIDFVNDGSKCSFSVKNKFTDAKLDLNVFFGRLRNEDKRPTHRKIQLGTQNDPRITQDGKINVILGIYCREHNDSLRDLTFAGYCIDPSTNYTSNTSIRGVTTEFIQEAKTDGFKKVNKSISVFRPEFIFYYIKNLQTLHGLSQKEKPDNSIEKDLIQKIFFGAPGTGKSYIVNKITKPVRDENPKQVEIVTFHPEFDYQSFVGSYKPTMVEVEGKEEIQYKFVPQAFTKIYVAAWEDLENPHYLQIEEINRGNCAEIFGDLFQLLDRNPDYEVTADEDLKNYLESDKGFGNPDHNGIMGGKLRLPNNLSILATMNTSDQSLFPMDSAFKRRWDWEYVPIEYDTDNESSKYKIQVGNKFYSWLKFLKAINTKIYDATESQDKQIGNWFVQPNQKDAAGLKFIIDLDLFINKVIFYLWNDVFKDEEESIFRVTEEKYIEDFKLEYTKKTITFEKFYEDKDKRVALVEYIISSQLEIGEIPTLPEEGENTELATEEIDEA